MTETQEVSMTKIITLIRGRNAQIDDDDFEMVSSMKWYFDGKYAINTTPGKKTIRMHQLVMRSLPGQVIDHKNGDGLDNRKENLRFCARFQNSWNMKIHKHNTSGIKGISWCKETQSWHAQFQHCRKKINLGCYDRIEDAEKIYAETTRKLRGEFA
jgi:hypothetical protein